MSAPSFAPKLLFLAAFSLSITPAAAVAKRQRGGGDGPAAVTSVGGALPEPTDADLRTSSRPYLIGAFDRLIIDVFGIEGLGQREIQADASGRISFPLVGVVEAAGKTPNDLAAIIADRLRRAYVRNPQVTVNLKDTSSQTVTVDGEVREPGIYPVIGEMTLVRAIATAKGTTENAKQRQVVVFRTVRGQKLAGVYDLKSIRQGRYEDPELFPNDIVLVGDNTARRLLRDLLGIVPAVTTPLIVLLRN